MTQPIRLLTPADVPQWMRLKEAAGWNQTPEDLRMLLELAPESCFGVDVEGILASTSMAICYGDTLAWIGMVLTLPEYRGRGLATILFRHTLDYLDRLGIGWSKLDATDMGLPLYRKFGFATECAVERWVREPAPCARVAEGCAGHDHDLDCSAFGADRRALLGHLSKHESCRLPGGDYAMARPGSKAHYFGPCVAGSPEAAAALLDWFLSLHSQRRTFWDLFPDHPHAAAIAARAGFKPVRKLWRMGRKRTPDTGALLQRHELVYGLAGFELG